MPEIGKTQILPIVKEVNFGLYLDGGPYGEILLPHGEILPGTINQTEAKVFLHFDSEDRLIATTRKPFVEINEFALLRVKSVNQIGAFMDWGLSKDLLVPFREQKIKLEKGRSYIVFVYGDVESQRFAASAKLSKFFSPHYPDLQIADAVDLIIWQQTDLGFKVIINHLYQGMLFYNSIFQELNIGQKIKGFVKDVREDGKIDVTLSAPGYTKVQDILADIVDYLKQNRGASELNDRTPPETIYQLFGVSKKTFKSALGNLYKQGIISIDTSGIKLIKN